MSNKNYLSNRVRITCSCGDTGIIINKGSGGQLPQPYAVEECSTGKRVWGIEIMLFTRLVCHPGQVMVSPAASLFGFKQR